MIRPARVIKGEAPDSTTLITSRPTFASPVIRSEVVAAKEEATQIVERAKASAQQLAEAAAKAAAREAAEKAVAKLAAGFLALREQEARQASKDRDRLIELSVVLAERLLGEALRVEPTRIAELAVNAIQEARGARQVRIDASPEDVEPLKTMLAALEQTTDVRADESLARGSLVVHTDLGKIDARLTPQLERLAVALKEALG